VLRLNNDAGGKNTPGTVVLVSQGVGDLVHLRAGCYLGEPDFTDSLPARYHPGYIQVLEERLGIEPLIL
jgi:hypothetical protein